MFFFRYTGDKVFINIKNSKYYSKNWFKEQSVDGSYLRPISFFIENRMEIIKPDIVTIGIPKEMKVKYIGIVDTVRVGNKPFPKNKWVTVPIDFDSRDKRGQDLFLALNFQFSVSGVVKDNLSDCQDGDRILILRKHGGLGDIIMQSLIFHELRRKFPTSEITYAIPKQFMSLFDDCKIIDHIVDVSEIETSIYRYIAKGEYAFIGDISKSCIIYEIKSIQEKGFVDKARTDIWAESMGLTLDNLHRHRQAQKETCIELTETIIKQAQEVLKIDDRKIIGIVPYSANAERMYPDVLTQRLIDQLAIKGYRVIVLHSHKLNFKNCENMGNLNLKILGGIISQMSLMISTDTGPLHYAGILGIPVIGLFGMTDSKVRLKYYKGYPIQGKCEKNILPCWYSVHDCKRIKSGDFSIASCMGIEPERIIAKVEDILNNKQILIETIKEQKIGLVIPVYNRMHYLKQTLDSLKASSLPGNLTILMIDDHSSENLDIFNKFQIPGIEIIKYRGKSNKGVWEVLKEGFDYLYMNGFDIMLNLDSDALVKKDWLLKLLNLHVQFPDTIISGFNSIHRHKIISQTEIYYLKETIGGLNMVFRWENYLDLIRPSFDQKSVWDWEVCRILKKKNQKFIVTQPSVIQHIGVESSLGHHAEPDRATDFAMAAV